MVTPVDSLGHVVCPDTWKKWNYQTKNFCGIAGSDSRMNFLVLDIRIGYLNGNGQSCNVMLATIQYVTKPDKTKLSWQIFDGGNLLITINEWKKKFFFQFEIGWKPFYKMWDAYTVYFHKIESR